MSNQPQRSSEARSGSIHIRREAPGQDGANQDQAGPDTTQEKANKPAGSTKPNDGSPTANEVPLKQNETKQK